VICTVIRLWGVQHGLQSRYDDKEDFAVVLQPFFKSTILPFNAEGQPDVTYFSQDCFHFSERGHADMAVAVWNNMMEPVGEKQTYNAFSNGRDRIKCPTEVRNQLQKHFLLQYFFTASGNPKCPNTVQAWLAAVLAVVGLLIGSAVTWLFFSYKARKNKKKMMTSGQMKGTEF
uniref:Uncharacterized protein n=1 Tax=Pundamilia nyererei TaxID=303518 RepID=A0A3B4GEZ2_9CICH